MTDYSNLTQKELTILVCESMAGVCEMLCVESNNPHYEAKFEAQSKQFRAIGKTLKKNQVGNND